AMRVPRRRLEGLAGFGLPALAPPASAATLHVPDAVTRSDCATTRLAGQRGVATYAYTPGALSMVTARLSGPAGSDWDLSVFDHATGRLLAGSGDWDPSEVVHAFARPGERLDVQPRRVSGPAASLALALATL